MKFESELRWDSRLAPPLPLNFVGDPRPRNKQLSSVVNLAEARTSACKPFIGIWRYLHKSGDSSQFTFFVREIEVPTHPPFFWNLVTRKPNGTCRSACKWGPFSSNKEAVQRRTPVHVCSLPSEEVFSRSLPRTCPRLILKSFPVSWSRSRQSSCMNRDDSWNGRSHLASSEQRTLK